MNAQQLRKLAKLLDKADNIELDILCVRGLNLPKPWEEQFRGGHDVTLSALEAKYCGLVHDIR